MWPVSNEAVWTTMTTIVWTTATKSRVFRRRFFIACRCCHLVSNADVSTKRRANLVWLREAVPAVGASGHWRHQCRRNAPVKFFYISSLRVYSFRDFEWQSWPCELRFFCDLFIRSRWSTRLGTSNTDWIKPSKSHICVASCRMIWSAFCVWLHVSDQRWTSHRI